MPRPPRTRRTAEEARTLILDAAERVFASASPDAVGLKEVGREAGVSHALVTHYFGTYEGLVEATLERRFTAAREVALARLARTTWSSPDEWPLLSVLIDLVRDPVTARLVTWAVLGGRAQASTFFAVKQRGLALIVDALSARLAALGVTLARPRIEFSVMAALAMTIGFAASGDLMHQALGHSGPLPLEPLAGEIHAMVRGYLGVPARRAAPPEPGSEA